MKRRKYVLRTSRINKGHIYVATFGLVLCLSSCTGMRPVCGSAGIHQIDMSYLGGGELLTPRACNRESKHSMSHEVTSQSLDFM